jgi:hypothetical protein
MCLIYREAWIANIVWISLNINRTGMQHHQRWNMINHDDMFGITGEMTLDQI